MRNPPLRLYPAQGVEEVDMESIDQQPPVDNPVGNSGPTVSLSGLLDLLDVLEAEINQLPAPASLFASELRLALAEKLGMP